MAPLSADLRKVLEKAVVAARDAAESACEAALRALGVPVDQASPSSSAEQRALRNALRAVQRQLGGASDQLVAECAYEQWHLMLFARFLAENRLLVHPSGAAVTLDEVAELAREQGGGNPWLLAADYAATMLPGIFKTSDPCVRLPLAPEARKALEDILTALPSEVFTADDALGWVYQFWQTKKKKEVNASERKIGGADLAPVTQLFTEHYMVRFLLENSLGAWWAARHPDSPLLAEWQYLRFNDDGAPAAGTFEGWPATAAEVTVMDPCCGSGHFLVEAFDMLRKMRQEEGDHSLREAVDAVLAENLYGLELDARCVQLAAFNLALATWKTAGYHELPPVNLACSGIPTRGTLEDWTRFAKGDSRLERALARLHGLFEDADTLGSLIDPRRAVEDGSLMSVPFEEVALLLARALTDDSDPVVAVFGDSAREAARAATFLASSYTLVATNVPYLSGLQQSETLRSLCREELPLGSQNLALAFIVRSCAQVHRNGTVAVITMYDWLFRPGYRSARQHLLRDIRFDLVANLGPKAFSTALWDFPVGAVVVSTSAPEDDHTFWGLDVSTQMTCAGVAKHLSHHAGERVLQRNQLTNPESRIVLMPLRGGVLLEEYADAFLGICSGDYPRFGRVFWELPLPLARWMPQQSTVPITQFWGGCEHAFLWDDGAGEFRSYVAERLGEGNEAAWIRGTHLIGHRGVIVSQTGQLNCSLFAGQLYDHNTAVLAPRDDAYLPAIWAYCASPEFARDVRRIDAGLKVTSKTLLKVPFNLAHWQEVAEKQYRDGLPEPHSEDPTQWLFRGNIAGSEQPLHVAFARMLGFRWPDQESDELDAFADEDGIVCLPSVAGEQPAHERLRRLLGAAYGEAFSQQMLDELLTAESTASLEDWLRDKAFASHAKLLHNRPFIWHVWDGRPDGFAALLNYHRLDRQNLEKLTFHHLGWWVERQQRALKDGVAGAEVRLAAAHELQRKLRLVLEGEPPYDVYVRWKPLAEQPLGWEPDLNDGVRLNIRPFVTAGVLRAKVSINWKKDRGKDPTPNASGTVERLNDLHLALAEKRAAREEAAQRG